jgi:hypothetical protein
MWENLFEYEWDDTFERERKNPERNRIKGKAAEDIVETELLMEGLNVERVHEGADFVARGHDFVTGEEIDKKVEVKSGNAELTDRQEKEKENSENYEVRRRDPFFF